MFGRFVKHHDTLTLYEFTSMLFLLSCSSLIHMFQSSGLSTLKGDIVKLYVIPI